MSTDSKIGSTTTNELGGESATSMRRAVIRMKALLPLNLSFPSNVDHECIPVSSSHTPVISDVQHVHSYSPYAIPSILARRSQKKFTKLTGLPLTLRPDQYRDTPIYTDAASPLLGRAYYSEDDVCFSCSPPGSSCDESCIFDEYDDSTEVWQPDRLEDELDLVPSTPLERASNWSFKCMGHPQSPNDQLFRDEALWLSNSPGWSEPNPDMSVDDPSSDVDNDGWYSDVTAESEDEEVFACATALAPSKAHVVTVKTASTIGLSIAIPPRSSSFAQHGFMKTKSARGENGPEFACAPPSPITKFCFSDSWIDEDETLWRRPSPSSSSLRASFAWRQYLAMTSPPTSPMDNLYCPDSEVFDPRQIRKHALNDIIVYLESSISGFPSRMLLPESPCIPIIRQWQLNPSSVQNLHNLSPPLNPNEWPNRPRSSTAASRISAYSCLSGAPSLSSLRKQIQGSNTRSLPFDSSGSFRSSRSTLLPSLMGPVAEEAPKPDLEPFTRIFPESTAFLRAALYAHVVAYNFVQSLLLTPKHSSNSTYASSIYEAGGVPCSTTTSLPLPAKAAAVLGAPPLPAVPIKITIGQDGSASRLIDGVSIDRLEEVSGRLWGCMEWLLQEMQPGGFSRTAGNDSVLLRAVLEIVRQLESGGGGGFLRGTS